MKVHDPDIQFNDDNWNRVIQSQTLLFDLNALVSISDQLRTEFHAGHGIDRELPEIKQEDWKTDLLLKYDGREIGYDLPCLLSAERPTRGKIMLCAQDPKRSGSLPGVTVATFFGIDNKDYRQSGKHYGAVWDLVRACVLGGYDVWVTDALKLFVGKHELWGNEPLVKLCIDVLEAEVKAFSPDLILAMGGQAAGALSEILPGRAFIKARHPSPMFAKKAWYLEGAADFDIGYKDGIKRYYLRKLFGEDQVPVA